METLKSGDAPSLVTNVEVMTLLAEHMKERKEETRHNNNNRQNQRRRSGVPRHVDWIEETVHAYLTSTPCATTTTGLERLPTLVTKLKSKRKIKINKAMEGTSTNHNNNGTTHTDSTMTNGDHHGMVKLESGVDEETNQMDTGNDRETTATAAAEVAAAVVSSSSQEDAPQEKGEEGGFGLTDAETLQVLNMMPQESVDIHLMIEDLTVRMTEERQEELLELIQSYRQPEQLDENGSANNNNNDDDAFLEDATFKNHPP
eukprot:scaffold19705_cov58-Attheya_sp.AAC.2